MKCKTCGRELYADGSCALMCVWTNQPEHPFQFPLEIPLRVTFKAVIPKECSMRMVKIKEVASCLE
jgi:hypothetical protein